MSRVQSTLRRAFAVRAARIVTTSLLVRVNVAITASRINVEAMEPFRTLFVSFDLSLIRYISFFFFLCTMKRKIISGKDTSTRGLNYKPAKCIVRSIDRRNYASGFVSSLESKADHVRDTLVNLVERDRE